MSNSGVSSLPLDTPSKKGNRRFFRRNTTLLGYSYSCITCRIIYFWYFFWSEKQINIFFYRNIHLSLKEVHPHWWSHHKFSSSRIFSSHARKCFLLIRSYAFDIRRSNTKKISLLQFLRWHVYKKQKLKIILTKYTLTIYCPYHTSGGMAEWLIAAVLKTAVPQGTQSSNLCPSAIEK